MFKFLFFVWISYYISPSTSNENENCLASHRSPYDLRFGYPDFYFKNDDGYKSNQISCEIGFCSDGHSAVIDNENVYPHKCSFGLESKCPVNSRYVEGALNVPDWKYLTTNLCNIQQTDKPINVIYLGG